MASRVGTLCTGMFVDVACVNNTLEWDVDQNYSADMDPQAADLTIVTQCRPGVV